MQLQESGEMYLESIYVLSMGKGHVRSVDISQYMNYSKPSVSRAVGILKNGGYIRVEEDGAIFLEPKGLEIAKKIYERHTLLSQLLISLGVNPETAAEDACKMEHAISDDSFEALKRHAQEKLLKKPGGSQK